MKLETKSIALFDDGTRVSTYLKLHFQGKPGFSVTRVYSRGDLEHRMLTTPFDIVIAPSGHPAYVPARHRLCLFWNTRNIAGRPSRSRAPLSLQFEIETPDTSLFYHPPGTLPINEQLDALAGLLARIDTHHKDLARTEAENDVLQSIIEHAMAGILHLVRTRIHWTNREAQRMLGRTGNELAGAEFASLFPDDRTYRDTMTSLMGTRDSRGWGRCCGSLAGRSGEAIECSIRMRRLDPMNSQKGYLVMIEDTSEKRHLESKVSEYRQMLARNEQRSLEAFTRMEQVLIKTDSNGRIAFWNSRAETTFGYQACEAAGRNILTLLTDPGTRSAKDMAVLLYDPGPGDEHSALQIVKNKRNDGRHLWAAWRTLAYRDDPGTGAGLVWIAQEIQEEGGEVSGRAGSWSQVLLEGTEVTAEVFSILLHIAIQLGRGGRESRKVGTSFMVGDADRVMAHSRQSSINAFEGRATAGRMVQDRGNVENLKNLALLDGAFVIGGSGYIHASSRHLLAEVRDLGIPQGFGTRHASVAAMTKITRSIGIVVSESGGTVSIFRDGTLAMQIEP